MSSPKDDLANVEKLYRQLAVDRVKTALQAFEGPQPVDRMFAQSAAALEDAAATLLHALTTFIGVDMDLSELFAEQAGALMAVAARFEEAADLARTRDGK